MGQWLLRTQQLELRPLPADAAAALPSDRERASHLLDGVALAADWPLPDLLDVLPIQAAAPPGAECFGVWVVVEHESATVVGDVGFLGAPDDSGALEIGFSVVPDRRRRGYAAEAATALVGWALAQPEVRAVVASCESDNVASIRTLARSGFRRTDEADGRIRWQYGREQPTYEV